MNKVISRVAVLATLAMLLPLFSHAQGVADDLHSLQGVLNQLYTQMMPLCGGLINVGRGIAGFAALWYIASRVWKHLAAAEPVDFYPLLRPFAIGFCIMIFPSVLSLINGILQPIVTATNQMVGDSNRAITYMLDPDKQNTDQDAGINSSTADPDKYYQYAHPDDASGSTSTIADQFSGWSFKNMIKKAIAELLNLLFEAAALCLDTIRTFKLVVLSILGPLCFGLSVFDGFQHTLKQWLARYVNVFMWLPVANIFGAIIAKIQENMIRLAQSGGEAGTQFSQTNTAYLIFLVIGIIGYFSVPGIAGYIINVGGHALFNRTSTLASAAVSYAGGTILQGFLPVSGQGSVPVTTASQGVTGDGGGSNAFMQGKVSGG